jgi:uncharacterized protein
MLHGRERDAALTRQIAQSARLVILTVRSIGASRYAMKVVVAGGTGFVGRSLVQSLARRGDTVFVLARDARRASVTLGKSMTVLSWTLEAGSVRDTWESAVKSADVIVNLAGAGIMDAAWSTSRKKELVASRVETTRALAATLATGTPETRRGVTFVSASAVGYYGMREEEELLVEDAAAGEDFLARLCVDWEGAARDATLANVRVVHPRLGIVLGRDGGALSELARPFRMHIGGPIGSGKQWVSWIHLTDVVQAILFAIDTPSLRGPVNLVAPHPVTMREEADTLAKVLGTHARLAVPSFALAAVLGRERARAILTGQRVSPSRLIEAGYAFSFTHLGPALEDLLAR